VGERRWKLVAANESTVVAKPFLDPIVMEDLQRNGRFANPSGTYERERFQVFGETDDFFD
jgi:hypothetical protein